jgi:hypothetical protein
MSHDPSASHDDAALHLDASGHGLARFARHIADGKGTVAAAQGNLLATRGGARPPSALPPRCPAEVAQARGLRLEARGQPLLQRGHVRHARPKEPVRKFDSCGSPQGKGEQAENAQADADHCHAIHSLRGSPTWGTRRK